MELALRIRVDRGRDVGDVGREEGREADREDTSSGLAAAADWRAGAGVSVSSGEDVGESVVGESVVGEATYAPRRRSCAISMNRRTCSSASSRFFVSSKCILKSRRPCTSITSR